MKQAIKAVRIVYGVTTEYTQADCDILNKIASLVIKHGGISVERIESLTGYFGLTIRWALWHLEAIETPAQLWILPELTD